MTIRCGRKNEKIQPQRPPTHDHRSIAYTTAKGARSRLRRSPLQHSALSGARTALNRTSPPPLSKSPLHPPAQACRRPADCSPPQPRPPALQQPWITDFPRPGSGTHPAMALGRLTHRSSRGSHPPRPNPADAPSTHGLERPSSQAGQLPPLFRPPACMLDQYRWPGSLLLCGAPWPEPPAVNEVR